MTTRKPGLGRGLGALLPDSAPKAQGASVLELQIDEVFPNPKQPRLDFQQEELQELAASIREVGLLQPVVVRPGAAGGYELLVGERRLRASKLAGLQTIPALVREADDKEALEQALVENLQRADLGPLEEAQAYENLIEIFEMTQEQVARRMGKSRAHVTNTLRLRDLSSSIKTLVAAGDLSAGHARALLAVSDLQVREQLARVAAAEGLTVRDVEARAREGRAGDTDPNHPRTKASPAAGSKRRGRFPDMEDALADRFSTDVAIEVGRGRGRIVVHFGSRDDLDRISRMMLNTQGG